MSHVVNDLSNEVDDMTIVVDDMAHVMSDPMSDVLDVSQKLRDIRQRLDELDAERAALQRQAAAYMEQLATTAGGQVMPPADVGLSARILWALRRHPDRPMAPADVAQILGLTGRRDLTNIRVGRDGRARRVAHGRYMPLDTP
jgi:TolA-binding protein